MTPHILSHRPSSINLAKQMTEEQLLARVNEYSPCLHGSQADDLAVEKVPLGQSEHLLERVFEYVPSGHGLQL